jgi:serine protease inhibitor
MAILDRNLHETYVEPTKAELAQEIYFNGYFADEYQKQFKTWQEFMASEDFDEECSRLRNKFD